MAKNKILVVDDSPTDTLVISNSLRADGYEVITARDGEEAMRRLDSDRPDLVLLDVVMPGKNGFQLCRQIRNDSSVSGAKSASGSRRSRDSPCSCEKRRKVARVWRLAAKP